LGEIQSRAGQPRLKGDQNAPTLLTEMNKPPSFGLGQDSKWTQANPAVLREMNKLPVFAVRKDYYKVH
jgi:hypothetical protein